VPFVRGNAGNKALVSSVLKRHDVSAIIHFGGSTLVPESVSRPLTYYENNTAVSRSLLEAAVENNIRYFLFSSTAAVYGNPLRTPVSEDAATQPLSPYGRSKLATEWMVRDVSAAHGLKHMILRYFNVAGADPLGRTGLSTPGASHVIKVAVEAALGKRSGFEIFGTDYPTPDGTCIRDFIHVTDLAEAHVAALFHLQSGGDSATLNCGYGRGYSVRDVLDMVRRVSGRHFAISTQDRRAGDIAISVADSSKIQALLDWRPRFNDLKTIITHALSWERRLASDAEASPNLVPEAACEGAIGAGREGREQSHLL
jgi:UDP-glucose 4-epimerase